MLALRLLMFDGPSLGLVPIIVTDLFEVIEIIRGGDLDPSRRAGRASRTGYLRPGVRAPERSHRDVDRNGAAR
jgi:hypothetical protein